VVGPVLQRVAEVHEPAAEAVLVACGHLLSSSGIRVEKPEYEPRDLVVDAGQLGDEHQLVVPVRSVHHFTPRPSSSRSISMCVGLSKPRSNTGARHRSVDGCRSRMCAAASTTPRRSGRGSPCRRSRGRDQPERRLHGPRVPKSRAPGFLAFRAFDNGFCGCNLHISAISGWPRAGRLPGRGGLVTGIARLPLRCGRCPGGRRAFWCSQRTGIELAARSFGRCPGPRCIHAK
jgi:hypothetical protein